MEILGDVGHLESRFPPFGDSVSISCAERTIGSVLCDMAQLEARIGPFGDSANLDAR
jgi:putative transposon-encoded protein